MKLFTMGSRDEDRSLTSGIPIPQWMKSKTENYGFDPSTLSPPTHEGEFFYFKLPKTQPAQSLNMSNLNEVIEVKSRAFDKHTDSCKQFIPIMGDAVHVQKQKITKPMGVDDGFKGEGAACGASVVEVAHQMLTNKGKGLRPLTRVETDGNLIPPSTYLQTRRNSKSLPASPVTSPSSSPIARRKNIKNRLFGLSSQSSENGLCESDENIDKKSGSSWILSSLFAATNEQKESGNPDSVVEKGTLVAAIRESNVVRYQPEGAKQSQNREPINTTAVDVTITPAAPPTKSFFKSKPYLRDLNLLTPSSM